MHIKLEVDSCPNDDNFVQCFFCPFLCSIYIILFSEFVPAKKTARFCLEFAFFSYVYFLCVGIPILKIVSSHAHMWVTSDVIKIIFPLS